MDDSENSVTHFETKNHGRGPLPVHTNLILCLLSVFYLSHLLRFKSNIKPNYLYFMFKHSVSGMNILKITNG